MNRRPNARISRMHRSWRVRVSGLSKFFADRDYGGTDGALEAAQRWRDEHWTDARPKNQKLSAEQRREIATSTDHYQGVALRYGISVSYVHHLRRNGS